MSITESSSPPSLTILFPRTPFFRYKNVRVSFLNLGVSFVPFLKQKYRDTLKSGKKVTKGLL